MDETAFRFERLLYAYGHEWGPNGIYGRCELTISGDGTWRRVKKSLGRAESGRRPV